MSPRALGILERSWPTLLLASVDVGIVAGSSSAVRAPVALLGAVSLALACTRAEGRRLLLLAATSLALVGLAWGGTSAEALERSVLASRVGSVETMRVTVTGPVRRSRFSLRAPGLVTRVGAERIRERVLLELPVGRSPPQGAVLEMRAQPERPRGPETGFDEQGWLARQGVHVVLHGRVVRVLGRRGGIGGVADRLRAHVEATLAEGTSGERRALVTGIVLGEESELDPALRQDFRASGLTHLLAVSGQNVAITAVGVVVAARVLAIGRIAGECLAIAAVLAYALAAGWQPSVVRATVAGLLASLAWLASRPRDRWHAMAVGALVLLAWSPLAWRDPGFQLSFAAVAAIFTVVPRIARWLEGTPISGRPAELLAVAAACGGVTAPIVLLQFGAVPTWTVPANMLAEPAMPPLVSLSLVAALVHRSPLRPPPHSRGSQAGAQPGSPRWRACSLRCPGRRSSPVESRFASRPGACSRWRWSAGPSWRTPRALLFGASVALVVAVGWWGLRSGLCGRRLRGCG